MTNVVEIYIQEEVKDITFDNDKRDEWNSKIEELGLNGQKELVGEKDSPIPFLWMNKSLVAIFETLCPERKKIENYSLTPIPLEALSTYGLAKKDGYFESIHIWYNDIDPDPAIIGIANGEKYLLARWGDVKRSLEELKEMAIDRWIKESKVELANKINEAQNNLANIGTLAQKKMNGEYIWF